MGYSTASGADTYAYVPSCYAYARPTTGRSPRGGMVGWATQLRLSDDGTVTFVARHRADMLAARLGRDDREWSYGEVGKQTSASGDVAIDPSGAVIAACFDGDAVYVSSDGRRSGRLSLALGAGGALVALALAIFLRRREA